MKTSFFLELLSKCNKKRFTVFRYYEVGENQSTGRNEKTIDQSFFHKFPLSPLQVPHILDHFLKLILG